MDDPPVWELDQCQKLISLMQPAYVLHRSRVESDYLVTLKRGRFKYKVNLLITCCAKMRNKLTVCHYTFHVRAYLDNATKIQF